MLFTPWNLTKTNTSILLSTTITKEKTDMVSNPYLKFNELKYAGTTWLKNNSDNFVFENNRVSKAGNTYLLYYLGEATNSVRRHVTEYAELYSKNILKKLNISTKCTRTYLNYITYDIC